MVSIFAAADAHRQALLTSEKQAALRMIDAYGSAWQRLQIQLKNVTDLITTRRAAGEAVNPAWLGRQQYVRAMLDEVAVEINRVAGQVVGPLITAEQQRAVFAAEQHAHELFRLGRGARPGVLETYARVPTQELTNLVGFLGNGSPLSRLLDTFGPEAARGAREALTTGVATGQSTRQIAAGVRRATGASLARALTISHTETTRAYRLAQLQSFRENPDVVKGWRWHSAKSVRTCLNCLSRDGSVWPLKTFMPAHPRCRCMMLPILAGADEPQEQTGAEWFERRTDETKARMMGARAFDAYREGRVALADFEGMRHSRAWGNTSYERSLREVLAAS